MNQQGFINNVPNYSSNPTNIYPTLNNETIEAKWDNTAHHPNFYSNNNTNKNHHPQQYIRSMMSDQTPEYTGSNYFQSNPAMLINQQQDCNHQFMNYYQHNPMTINQFNQGYMNYSQQQPNYYHPQHQQHMVNQDRFQHTPQNYPNYPPMTQYMQNQQHIVNNLPNLPLQQNHTPIGDSYLNAYMSYQSIPPQNCLNQPTQSNHMSDDSVTMRNAVELDDLQKDKNLEREYHYQILQRVYPNIQITLIGKGGFGNVFRVGNDLAVKAISCLDEENFRIINREASRKLDHDHILKIKPNVKVIGHTALIESEYIGGGTLLNFVTKLSPKMQWMVLEQLSSALLYMHLKDLVHRDVKLSNVLVKEYSGNSIKVVLGDFGLTRSMETMSTQQGLSGTHDYLAPELCTTQNPAYTPASDVFALGLVMLKVISGTNLSSGNISLGGLIAIEHKRDVRHGYSEDIICALTHKSTSKMASLICMMLRKCPDERISCAEIVSICRTILLNEKSDYSTMGVGSSLYNQFKESSKDSIRNVFQF